jgi:hypothetical protein
MQIRQRQHNGRLRPQDLLHHQNRLLRQVTGKALAPVQECPSDAVRTNLAN